MYVKRRPLRHPLPRLPARRRRAHRLGRDLPLPLGGGLGGRAELGARPLPGDGDRRPRRRPDLHRAGQPGDRAGQWGGDRPDVSAARARVSRLRSLASRRSLGRGSGLLAGCGGGSSSSSVEHRRSRRPPPACPRRRSRRRTPKKAPSSSRSAAPPGSAWCWPTPKATSSTPSARTRRKPRPAKAPAQKPGRRCWSKKANRSRATAPAPPASARSPRGDGTTRSPTPATRSTPTAATTSPGQAKGNGSAPSAAPGPPSKAAAPRTRGGPGLTTVTVRHDGYPQFPASRAP